MNKNDFNKYIELKKEFEDRVFEIIEIMAKTENKRFKIDELQNIEIEDENINIYFEEEWCGGGWNCYSYSFPKNYIYVDDWVIKYSEKVKLEQEIKNEAQKEREVTAQKIREDYDLKQLKKLKEKYGE